MLMMESIAMTRKKLIIWKCSQCNVRTVLSRGLMKMKPKDSFDDEEKVLSCISCKSNIRYTVKEHVETHISGFCHQCPLCSKTCKTRNALRVHTIRKHNQRSIANCDTVTRVVNPQVIAVCFVLRTFFSKL